LSNQYLNSSSGVCTDCDSAFTNCNQCTYLSSSNTVECHTCHGGLQFLYSATGTKTACGCNFVQFIDKDFGQPKSTWKCTKCHDEIPNCNSCSVVSEETNLLARVLTCTECKTPLFIDSSGHCVDDSCRTYQDVTQSLTTFTNAECTKCNNRGGALTWKPYEDQCVLNCPYPYITKDITTGTAPNQVTTTKCVIGNSSTASTLVCNPGFFYPGSGTVCETCNKASC